MKKSVRTSHSSKVSSSKASLTRTPARTKSVSLSKKSGVSRVSKSVRNYGKRSLRAILLSHTFHSGFKIVAIAFLVIVPFYGAYAYIGKTVANEIVISKSQILDRVSKHMDLPLGDPLAVVRVQDADTLKKQNSFYDQIKSGDYIIMYKSKAIIYDLRNDNVLAVKNINLDPR